MSTIETLLLALLSVIGALFSAVLGWLDSGEAFSGRKFASSTLRAIVSGFVVALGFQTVAVVVVWDYFLAFLTGAGVDVLGHRVAGAVSPEKEHTKT